MEIPRMPNQKDYSSNEEWWDAYDKYIEEYDAIHYKLKIQGNHPQTCCSEDCPKCDSVGLFNHGR